MDYILKMDGIDKSFSGVKVLDNVSFHLKKGQVHALVGGNGAGKSTLMKILTGVYTRDAGTIEVDGKPVNFSGYRDASNAGIRMIYQELSLIPTLTVAENIFLNQEKKKGNLFLDDRTMVASAQNLLSTFGINISPTAVVNTLGVGYCQLVEIAKALAKEAKVLVMDEPTASLSESEVVVLFDIVQRLKKNGVSIVYISHRMNEILKIADEVTVLHDGKNVITAPSSELTVQSIVNYMMGDKGQKVFGWQKRDYQGSGEILLEVDNLTINNWIKDLSFQVKKGEVLGLAGLMGSGRTEIVESLFGIRKYQKGRILIDGKEVRINNVQKAIDAGLALVPEDRRRQGLILMHSVKQNVTLPLLKDLKRKVFINDRKANLVTRESIEDLQIKTDGINKITQLLSGGNQQKIVIAKWLRRKPKLLLLDEPTAGIDIGAKGEIISIIREFADQGNSVILISSEIAELYAICDRIIVLKKGQITAEFHREDIESEEVIQHAIQE